MISKNFVLKFLYNQINLICNCLKYLIKLLSLFLIFFIQLIRPFFGQDNVCPFTVGCTQYAIMQLKEVNFFIAIYRIVKRLLLCNPITNSLRFFEK